MITAIIGAVLPPLIRELTDDFLDRRRDRVTVAELQHQVTHLLISQRQVEIELTQVRMAVLALTRYLAVTQNETFVFQNDQLELASPPPARQPAAISKAIEDFHASVEARVNQSRKPPSKIDVKLRPNTLAPNSLSAASKSPSAVSADALARFFDGFDEEVMRERLHHSE